MFREMVRILKWLNGSNDVELTQIPGGRIGRTFRELRTNLIFIDESLDWSFNAINLFQNS